MTGLKLKNVLLDGKDKLFLPILLFFFVLISDFTTRVAITLFFAVFALSYHREFRKKHIFLAFMFLYLIAYIYSPYWNIFPTVSSRISALILLLAAGFFWAYQISSDVKINIEPVNKILLAVLGIMVYFVNYRPLKADIPWRGDEDFHINCVITLSRYIDTLFTLSVNLIKKEPLATILAVLLFVLIISLFSKYKLSIYKKTIVLVFLLSLPVGIVILYYPSFFRHFTAMSLRYPLIQKWFNLFFTYPYLYDEIALYRAVPFLSSVFIGWFLFYEFDRRLKRRWLSLFLSFSVVTCPLIYYYTGLLYLEMPVVALMIVCVFNVKSLVSLEYKELKKTVPWYCLLLISFLKETALIFILMVLGSRFIYQLNKGSYRNKVECILTEDRIYFLVSFPLFVYLFFRIFFLSYRGYGMHFYNLLNISNYFVFVQALFNQLGILFVIGILGLLVIFKKDRTVFMILLALFIGIMCFFIADNSTYAGYSRWNLYLLPIILFTFFNFVVSIKKHFLPVLIPILLSSNIFLSPIHLNGIRYSNWGCPRADVGESVYPYKEAAKWLSNQNDVKYLLVTGSYYPYNGFVFYFNKYDFHPVLMRWKFSSHRFGKTKEWKLLRHFFKAYSRLIRLYSKDKSFPGKSFLKVDTILYHSVNNIELNIGSVYGNFKVVKKISNLENTLYILKRAQLN